MRKETKRKSRRDFLAGVSRAAALGAVAGLVPITGAIGKEQASGLRLDASSPFMVLPYLQALTPDSVDIMFMTRKLAYSWIEYGETSLDRKAHAIHCGLVEAHNQLNCIRLSNLRPDTTYRYRVATKEITQFRPYDLKYGELAHTETFTFRTPGPGTKEVSCLILNDIHDRPNSFGELLRLNGDEPYDFVALNGDMFDHQENEAQLVDHLLTPCTHLFASSIPFLMIRGNHETRGKYAREFRDYFSYSGGQYYFAFQWGPVHWTVLDSGEDKEDTHPVYGGIVDFDGFREEQAKWLEAEMQKAAFKAARFRVVFMHIPPYHSGEWHGTLHCRKVFGPLFEKYGVDMVISGHTHRFGVHAPDKDHAYPIVIGGGPKEGNRTLIKLKADTKRLQVIMIRDDGERVGEYVIRKDA